MPIIPALHVSQYQHVLATITDMLLLLLPSLDRHAGGHAPLQQQRQLAQGRPRRAAPRAGALPQLVL